MSLLGWRTLSSLMLDHGEVSRRMDIAYTQGYVDGYAAGRRVSTNGPRPAPRVGDDCPNPRCGSTLIPHSGGSWCGWCGWGA